MRLVKAIEEIITRQTEPYKLEMKPSDKVVGVLVRNQGTATALTGMNSSKPFNKVLPGASMPYGIEGAIMDGVIMIDFEATGDAEAVIVTYRDAGDAPNC